MIQYRIVRYSILLILTGFIFQLQTYPQSIVFNNLSVEDGLSNSDVNTMIQDQDGFIWFGTDDGLNRYDGYNFKVFRNIPGDSTSLSDNSIWALTIDRKGNLWIGTKAGFVNRYDPLTEKFTSWEIKSTFAEENSVTTLYEDSKAQIWIGSYKEGLYKLNPNSNTIQHWKHEKDNPSSISHNFVKSIIEDCEGNILVGTYIGFNKLNPGLPHKGFKRFYYNSKDENSISNNLIWAFTQSNTDKYIVWVGTADGLNKYNCSTESFEKVIIQNTEKILYANSVSDVIEESVNNEKYIFISSYVGLFKLDLKTGNTFRFKHDPNDPKSLIDNQINKIIKDRSGVVWIATENGVSYYSPKKNKFNFAISSNPYNFALQFFKNKNVTAIEKSTDGMLWIGTSEGLFYFNINFRKEKIYKLEKLGSAHVWSLSVDSTENLWIGTYGSGLKKLNLKTKEINSWDLDNPKIRTQSIYYNKSILSDSKNKIWVGYWGVGIAKIDPLTNKFKVWLNEPGNIHSLSYNDVWTIKEDQCGRIWIGTTGGGLNLFDNGQDEIFYRWTQDNSNHNSLSSNNIYSILVSNLNNKNNRTILWIGTNNGLNQFIVNDKSINGSDINPEIKTFSVTDGLSDNSVNSILEDDNGNLWLGTGSGISFFDVSKNSFANFTADDGLNGVKMNYESALQLHNGLMLFGSTKGLNIFDPAKIELSKYKPQVVITDFQIFNQSVEVGGSSLLKESISKAKLIELPHGKNVFSFQFAALDYNSPGSIKYAYKMEGFDEDWIESDTRRFATYTNLNPGTYTFKVKSTNADRIWNDNFASIEVFINPPWWRTPYAYYSYIILIGLGLFAIRRFEMSRTKLRNELRMREIEAQQKTELESMKSRFFANLSHEFRTPLTLIKGPLQLLKKNKNALDEIQQIDIIERNSDKLQELIDQLLVLSQLENAVILLKTRKENLVSILKGVVFSFEPLALQKKISLKFNSSLDFIDAWVDHPKFEKIVNNLLSNAFKFTPESGVIKVNVNSITNNNKEFAEITVSDSGIGISKDKLNKIFDRFYQIDDSLHRSYSGSGIGLSLVKELIVLHKWEIFVESEVGKGTKFRILIPLWEDYLIDSEKVLSEDNQKIISKSNLDKKSEFVENEKFAAQNKIESNNILNKNKPSILIVEDSEDLRKYLTDLLKNDYTISEAKNGEEGIKTASDILPDLIISDVMMPSMDGFEFCERIKSQWQTSDIPLILLTAKASFESKLEGLEIGADEYLTKPFDSRELFVRIKNLSKNETLYFTLFHPD